ncbi:MAG: nucleotidyltransferase family protein [Saprospiraceae bacterium]|nr:nucleotidyltransferase family protein [Saprospiraceae bacterium]MCB9325058.1 nucleotidyltransferase family protein [Lewinellaceae bacterium]
MKAIIFAAGLGTRLRPLTDTRPKALIEINGVPLLEIAVRKLIKNGCLDIIINVHHFGEQIIDFLKTNDNFGINIAISDERDLLLDTGGGLKKAAWFLHDEPFMAINSDILTDMDFKAFYEIHCRSNALATLAVRDRASSRYLQFDQENKLCGWKNIKTGEVRASRDTESPRHLAFSGIQVIHPDIFKLMPDESKFSIIDVYLEAAKKYDILAYPHDEDLWLDVGKPEALEKGRSLFI